MPSAGHYTFPMRCDTPPFDNIDLRLALKYAIDRDEMVDKILRGYGKLGNDHPIPEFDPFYNADLPQREYDPDKAKFHLEKSGHSGPVTLHIADAAFTGAVDAATLYQQHAQAAGIDLVAAARARGRLLVRDLDAEAVLRLLLGRPADRRPDALGRLPVGCGLERVLLEARGLRQAAEGRRAPSSIPPSARQMYAELQRMVYEDGGEIIPMFNNFLYGAAGHSERLRRGAGADRPAGRRAGLASPSRPRSAADVEPRPAGRCGGWRSAS